MSELRSITMTTGRGLLAVVYLRHFLLGRPGANVGSGTARHPLADVARTLGYLESRILVIDEDLGRSALPTLTRPGFARMRDLLRAGRVECILVEDVPSITRSIWELADFLGAVIEHGVALYCDGRLYNDADWQAPPKLPSTLAAEIMAERRGSGPAPNSGAAAARSASAPREGTPADAAAAGAPELEEPPATTDGGLTR